jgi:hypothetical protein
VTRPKKPTLAQLARCGEKGCKPEGWELSRYPQCNRPIRHTLPHREYRKGDAVILHEWDEPLVLDDTALRRYWASHNKARSR